MTATGTTITEKAAGSKVQVDGGKKLTLTGGATLQGDAANSIVGATTNLGTIDVGTASLLSEKVTNSGGTIEVDTTLTLSGTEIIGGTINDGGAIVVAGASKIDGTAGNNVALNNGAVTVNAALTLDDVTASGTDITDTNGSTIELDNNVTLTNSATIQGGATKAPVTNLGPLEVAGPASLLNDTLTNTGHIVQVDDGKTLTLDGTTINGGTINDFSTVAGGGIIDVTGASTIAGTSTTDANLTGAGAFTSKVTLDAALTLDITSSSTTSPSRRAPRAR